MGSKGLKGSQNASKRLKTGPKWPKVGSKWPEVGSKWSKMAQSTVKMGQNRSTLAQNGAKWLKMAKIGPKRALGPNTLPIIPLWAYFEPF